jgi:hypothetical protein
VRTFFSVFIYEVRRPHPVLDDSKRVFDSAEVDVHFLRMLIKPALDCLDNMFMFPARDAVLFASGTALLDIESPTGFVK